MDDSIHYLPLFCQQLMRAQVSRVYVRRWLERARGNWLAGLDVDRAGHRQWEGQPLTRAQHLIKREALLYAREHRMCVEHALAHLARFAAGGALPEVYRASAWCARGERAREEYVARRARLEREKAA